MVGLDAMIWYFSSLPCITKFLIYLRHVVPLQVANIMPLKNKVRHGSTLIAPEEVPHDPFVPRHPPDENECEKLIAKRPIVVECHTDCWVSKTWCRWVTWLLQVETQQCYPIPVWAIYNNIKNVDEEKYSFNSSFKGVVVRVSPSLIARTLSLETPNKSINFCIPEIDIKAMLDTITKELCDHSF